MQFRWGGNFEAWARNYVRANRWKIRHYVGDEEDGVQQCVCVFLRCNDTYQHSVDSEKWFMAIFKTAVHRYFMTLATRDTRLRLAKQALRNRREPEGISFDKVLIAHESMSAELRTVLSMIADAPSEVLNLLLDARLLRSHDTAGLSRRWRRLTNMPGSSDLVKELLELLG